MRPTSRDVDRGLWLLPDSAPQAGDTSPRRAHTINTHMCTLATGPLVETHLTPAHILDLSSDLIHSFCTDRPSAVCSHSFICKTHSVKN